LTINAEILLLKVSVKHQSINHYTFVVLLLYSGYCVNCLSLSSNFVFLILT